MNILTPELIWVEGRCYRLLGSGEYSNNHEISPYVEDDHKMDSNDSETECSDTEITIEPYGATKFKHTFHVAKSFFPYIAGSKHAVRKRLETETNTIIQIPKVGEDGDVVIIGYKRKGIMTARHRINLLMETARRKIPPTHFLSVPLNEGQIIMKFNAFKNEVLTNSENLTRGIKEAIFQVPSKLHLTFGVLKLLDDKERNEAIEALNYCKEHILKPMIKKHGQIPIHLRGTSIMNDDPSETKILYANIVDENGILQEVADKILHYYISIGLMNPITERVKLHVTLINTKFEFRKEEMYQQRPGTCDTTEIMKIHAHTFFGETTLKQIDISQRHTISSSGYYQATAYINLLEEP